MGRFEVEKTRVHGRDLKKARYQKNVLLLDQTGFEEHLFEKAKYQIFGEERVLPIHVEEKTSQEQDSEVSIEDSNQVKQVVVQENATTGKVRFHIQRYRID